MEKFSTGEFPIVTLIVGDSQLPGQESPNLFSHREIILENKRTSCPTLSLEAGGIGVILFENKSNSLYPKVVFGLPQAHSMAPCQPIALHYRPCYTTQ